MTHDLLLLITEKLEGYRLPIEQIVTQPMGAPVGGAFRDKLGEVEVKISNLRIHKTMLSKFQSLDEDQVHVEDDMFGGKLVDERSQTLYEKTLIHGLK